MLSAAPGEKPSRKKVSLMSEDQIVFHETPELIKKGGDVTQTELVSASAYAHDNFKEIMRLLSALLSGYEALQAELVRKDQVIEARNARIHSLNEVLAETNRRLQLARAAAREGGSHA